jgi:hypothetical protein
MSFIGAFWFMKMEGPQIPALAAAVEIIDREAVDSVASRVDALKAEDITKYTTEPITYLINAQMAADDYAYLKGRYVTVADDLGRIVYNVLVVDVRVINVQAVMLSQPAGINYLVNAVWLLKPTL